MEVSRFFFPHNLIQDITPYALGLGFVSLLPLTVWCSGSDLEYKSNYPGSSVPDSRSSDPPSQKSLEQTPTNKSLYLCSTYTSMDLSLSLSFPPSIDTFLWRKPINLALLKCILSGMQMYDCAEDD